MFQNDYPKRISPGGGGSFNPEYSSREFRREESLFEKSNYFTESKENFTSIVHKNSTQFYSKPVQLIVS